MYRTRRCPRPGYKMFKSIRFFHSKNNTIFIFFLRFLSLLLLPTHVFLISFPFFVRFSFDCLIAISLVSMQLLYDFVILFFQHMEVLFQRRGHSLLEFVQVLLNLIQLCHFLIHTLLSTIYLRNLVSDFGFMLVFHP